MVAFNLRVPCPILLQSRPGKGLRRISSRENKRLKMMNTNERMRSERLPAMEEGEMMTGFLIVPLFVICPEIFRTDVPADLSARILFWT